MFKVFWIILGSISLLFGIIGIFLPILPTTPFLLLAAFSYMRGSKKLYFRLIHNRYLGKYIVNYYEKKGIPLKVKVWVIILLWLSISYSVFIIIENRYIDAMLLVIAIVVSYHILKQKTLLKGE